MADHDSDPDPSDSDPVPHGSEGDVTPREPEREGDVMSFLGKPNKPGELGRLGQYRILKELGRGGMGVVLLGEDMDLHRPAAIKMMLPRFAENREARARFIREARAAALIRHGNVVLIYGVGTYGEPPDDVPYIAMELLEGVSLEDRLRAAGTLPLAEVVRIGRQVAEGLAAAHRRGVVHRDIKPGNLWLAEPDDTVKLLDFGLARDARDTAQLTAADFPFGTPAYFSPEQTRGESDTRSDLFSLGAVLYRLTTGRLPFKASRDMIVVVTSLALDTPKPAREWNPTIPPDLDSLIKHLLAKSPDDRPQTAAEVAAELALIGSRLAAAAAADTIPPRLAAKTAKPALAVDSVPAEPAVAIGSMGFANNSQGPTEPKKEWRQNEPSPAKKPLEGRRVAARGVWPIIAQRGQVAAAILTVLIAGAIVVTMRRDWQTTAVTTPASKPTTVPSTTAGWPPPGPNPLLHLPPATTRESPIGSGTSLPPTSPLPPTPPPASPFPPTPTPLIPDVLIPPANREGGYKADLEIAPNTKMRFCWIPPGRVLCGSPESEEGRLMTGEGPGTYVTRSGFWMAKYAVTQVEYLAVTGRNPSAFAKTGSDETLRKRVESLDTSLFPVECVSREDCLAFIESINAYRRGKGSAVVPAELPGIYHWEYACRGGHQDERPFYWGRSLDGTQANCNGKSPYPNTEKPGVHVNRPTAVGSYEKLFPHPWGLCDMTGNVWQWCGKSHNLGDDETRFVLRGGSWESPAVLCRSARYDLKDPAVRSPDIGFRLCIAP